jgi:S1-C subfamily serine protease
MDAVNGCLLGMPLTDFLRARGYHPRPQGLSLFFREEKDMEKLRSGRFAGRLSPRARRLIAFVAVALVAVAILGFAVTACGGTLGSTGTTDSQLTATTSAALAGATTTSTTSDLPPASPGEASPATEVAKVLGPSVVNIKVTGTSSGGQGPFGFGQQGQPFAAEGSGVIYRSDGMIITNNHVITDDADNPVSDIKVTFATGETLPATIVGRDPLTDLAVVKVQPTGKLPAAKFVAGAPQVGEYAVAIGSPLGFENSVTLGIVSGLGRSLSGISASAGIAYTNLIQTDAPISPGNSGGALANAKGEVIGINVAYLPPGQTGAVNIGFAIPSVTAVSVADQIIATGKAVHAYLGVGTQPVTPQLQEQFGLSRSSGLMIAEVAPNSPASQAGLQQGDIILKVDGQDVTDSAALAAQIRNMQPGDQVKLVIDRKGTEQTINVTLAERPADY